MSNFFAIPITDEWGTTYQLTTAGYTALVVLMLALLLLACFIGNSVKQPKFSARQLVDYIFAFGALGLSGLFSKSKNGLVKGYIAGVLGRYFFAFLSGMIFFGAYAADYGMSAPVYSLVYNGIYLSVEAVLTLIILYLPPVKKVMGQLKTMATQR